jgi:hypothetical protein
MWIVMMHRRCYKMDGLSIPEVKDCVKSAALGLLYTAPHATTTTTLQQQLEEELRRMVRSTSCSQSSCACCVHDGVSSPTPACVYVRKERIQVACELQVKATSYLNAMLDQERPAQACVGLSDAAHAVTALE